MQSLKNSFMHIESVTGRKKNVSKIPAAEMKILKGIKRCTSNT
jgi:hypothetical protein